MGLAAVFAFGMRLCTVSWQFGVISASLPVLHVPLAGDEELTQAVRPTGYINQQTPAIVMANDAFFLGDLAAFSVEAANVRNKIRVSHHEGAPQLRQLMAASEEWHTRRLADGGVKNPGFVVLIPSGDWPAAIVMQVVHHLKESALYNDVILGGGLR